MLIIIPFYLKGQINIDSFYKYNEWELLKHFDSSEYIAFDTYRKTGTNIMQWYSYHYLTTPNGQQITHICINVTCNYEELQLLWSDFNLYKLDLWLMFMEAPPEIFTLFARNNRFEIHRPGLIYPIYENYDIINSELYLDNSKPNPEFGFYRRLVRGALIFQNRIPIAIKRVQDIDGKKTWVFSMALLLKRK